MPRAPTLIGHPKESVVRERRLAGQSIDQISAELQLPKRQVQTFCAIVDKERTALRLTAPPTLPPDATPRQNAEAHAQWLKAQIDKAVKEVAPPKEIASLSGQYVSAMRLVAQLSGALEITAAQILKSTDFARCVGALQRAVGDDQAVWERWEKELATLMGEA